MKKSQCSTLKDIKQILSDLIKENNPQDKELIEFYEDQPENVKSILESYGSIEAMTYEELTGLQKNLETIGYTFDYGLDAQPFNLRKI